MIATCFLHFWGLNIYLSIIKIQGFTETTGNWPSCIVNFGCVLIKACVLKWSNTVYTLRTFTATTYYRYFKQGHLLVAALQGL